MEIKKYDSKSFIGQKTKHTEKKYLRLSDSNNVTKVIVTLKLARCSQKLEVKVLISLGVTTEKKFSVSIFPSPLARGSRLFSGLFVC